MKRRTVRRLGGFVFVLVAALAVLVVMRRGPRRRGGDATAAGGVAVGDRNALVEDARRYRVQSWSFSLDRFTMTIEDAGLTSALDVALKKSNADLVVNGGFFDPDGKAVGLALSDGVVLSRFSKGLTGGVLTADGETATLAPTEGFELPPTAKFGVQCRPRLVVERVANVKSDDKKRAERTALCIRDAGKVVEVVLVRGSDDGESPGPSLFALASHLVERGCESALNLDGGPSTGAAWKEGDDVKLLAPRGPVRHVIAFRPR